MAKGTKASNDIITQPHNEDGLRLGIDLGGSKILALVIAPDGSIIGRAKKRTKPKVGYDGVLARIRKAADKALDEAGVSLNKEIKAIGVAVPGPVLPEKGIIQKAVNLGWETAPIAADLSRHFDNVPVAIGNDVNIGALGEASYGVSMGSTSSLALFVGTGLGGGLINNGKVINGTHGFAGEIGHIPCPFTTAVCTCGQVGCLEMVASKRGLQQYMRSQRAAGRDVFLSDDEINDLRSSAIRRAWEAKCSVMHEALALAAKGVAWGAALAANTFDPEVVVLGGGVIEEMEDELLPQIQSALKDYTYLQTPPQLEVAQLGGDAVAIGAAVISGTVA